MISPLSLLEPSITPEIREMALNRLLTGNPLAREKEKLTDAEIAMRKLALLVVRAINPHEQLNKPEEAILRGMCLSTMRSAKNAKLLSEIN